MTHFMPRLRSIQQATQSVLCVGLDPDPDRFPHHLLRSRSTADAVLSFNRDIIAATAPYACAYKLNFAFYEALGPDAYSVLSRTLECLPSSVLSIADGKRGDIGNSARFYARAIFEELGFDACTVAPYMGSDAVAPFLAYEGKAAFILARTSNPSGSEFQDLLVGSERLCERVARCVAEWNLRWPGTAGLVVGATSPQSLVTLRALCPGQPFLIPGLGAQGGKMEDVHGLEGPLLVSSSRRILYASQGEDFAERAAEQARDARALFAFRDELAPD